jgi:hypothetical protein
VLPCRAVAQTLFHVRRAATSPDLLPYAVIVRPRVACGDNRVLRINHFHVQTPSIEYHEIHV